MNVEIVVLWFVTFVISATVHEAAHALFGLLGGDRTGYNSGQVTLNPLPHIRREPFGMVVLPLLSLFMIGWCFGFASTPYNAIWADRFPKRAALMSAAGPLSNVLLGAIAFAVLWYVGYPHGSTEKAVHLIAATFFFLNLLLALLNLLPIAPLDGAGIVQGLLPKSRNVYDLITRIPYSGIIIFIVLIQVLPHLFGPVFNAINGLLPYPVDPKELLIRR